MSIYHHPLIAGPTPPERGNLKFVQLGTPVRRIAVHVSQPLAPGLTPLVCIAGYNRNMSDFEALAEGLAARPGWSTPLVLIDLAGRGRSDHLGRQPYSTLSDADDVSEVLRALAIPRAVFLGQGHGAQVIMALASLQPTQILGSILVNAGPTPDPRAIVRMRLNNRHLERLKGEDAIAALRQITAVDFPTLPEAQLDRIAARVWRLDSKGRVNPLYDRRLIAQLENIAPDDSLETQWPYFDALAKLPMMFVRTSLTDRLGRTMLAEMRSRRPEATLVEVENEGSPALLAGKLEQGEIAGFLQAINRIGSRKRGHGAIN